jgi:hypothetical protein
MKREIVKIYVTDEGEDLAEYTQVIAVDDEGNEYIIEGAYCGGVPVSYWKQRTK